MYERDNATMYYTKLSVAGRVLAYSKLRVVG